MTEPTMTRVFREKWYERLTDGSFRRSRYELVNSDELTYRCCLGVARAVGEELGLLQPDVTIISRSYLNDDECAILGIKDQQPFATANDDPNNKVAEGQFYPQQVLDLVMNYPVKDGD